MLLYVLLVGSVLACLVFILLMLMLDSDVTTGYYDKFGGRLDQSFAGKVPERLSYPGQCCGQGCGCTFYFFADSDHTVFLIRIQLL